MFHELRALDPNCAAFRRLRERIIEQCLPLADHIARRYHRGSESLDDLVQVARVGLLNAVNRYDPDAGDFLAFAVPTVMGEVKRYYRDFSWAVKVPRRLKDIYPHIAPTISDLSQKLGRAPTPSELAAELRVPREDLVEGLVAGASYTARSIDAVFGDDDDGVAIVDRLGGPDPAIRHIEDREDLRAHLATLPRREQQILQMRFFESLTQSEIAARVGLSQMHVSRLLARALDTLRERMSDDGVAPMSRVG
nr:SigB/SigF/SigG family RNA polymerase sigma factor [Mycolicibacterium sediminis]